MAEQPENDLEKALRLAMTDPAVRPHFLGMLLEATVYVLVPPNVNPGKTTLQTGDRVSFRAWEKSDGTQAIPFFTSMDVLKQSVKEKEGYLGLPARDLFEITRGARLVLNPRSPYGKEFVPDEIEALLAGGLKY